MATEHPDKQLIEDAQQHTDAYAALYNKYVDRIFQYIYYKTGQHRDTAEDLTADVFTRALRNLHNFQWQGYPYSSYLYQVARSVCQEHYARSEKTPIDISTVAIGLESIKTANTGEKNAELYMLWEKIEELKPPLPEIFELRYLQDLAYEEIAAIMGKKPGTIRTALSRAIKKLQESYT